MVAPGSRGEDAGMERLPDFIGDSLQGLVDGLDLGIQGRKVGVKRKFLVGWMIVWLIF